MLFSTRAEQLILFGAEAIREQGREEVRQQFAAERQREMELDDLALRFTSREQADEAHKVGIDFLLREMLRQAVHRKYCGTLRDENRRCFALVLTGLTEAEMAALRMLTASILATKNKRRVDMSEKSETPVEAPVQPEETTEVAPDLPEGATRQPTPEDPEGDGLTKGQTSPDVHGDVLGL